MPTSRLPQASNQEGKILLALQAYKKGQVSSLRKASVLYDVPHSTLHDRLKGRTTREHAQERNRKLSVTEEITLTQWILSMDERGKPPPLELQPYEKWQMSFLPNAMNPLLHLQLANAG